MKVTFYANAMVLLESTDTRVLCDPWVTFDGQSESGIYNFPECHMTRGDVAAIKPDYIYITHTHTDHFDPPTLELFPKDTPILVSYYEHNFTERAVRGLGFTDVRVAVPDEGLPLNGDDHCWIEPSAYYPDVDSIAVFRLGGQTAINVNDNVFDRDQCLGLRERVGRIDIALIPSGAHGPWPMFFENLSDEEKAMHAAKRSADQKEAFKNYIRALQPRYVVPIAGGIMAGGDKVRQYKYSGIRPRSEVVAAAREELDFEPVLLSEGCSFDFEIGERQGEYVESTFETEQDYMDLLARKPSIFSPGGKFYVALSERIDLTRLLKLARQAQRKWQERQGVTSRMAYYFDVGEETLYRLTLGDDDVTRVREEDIGDESYEIFRLPYELLLGLLTRHYVWSNVKTQHVTHFRKGDRMDPELMLMLNYLQT